MHCLHWNPSSVESCRVEMGCVLPALSFDFWCWRPADHPNRRLGRHSNVSGFGSRADLPFTMFRPTKLATKPANPAQLLVEPGTKLRGLHYIFPESDIQIHATRVTLRLRRDWTRVR